ncbi:pre-mRNA cleavage complex 2 protein Pcf11 [Cydia strobilella]|uniref:pre-mRNA cleavage complex 2 protein Pcf11 n=1 Tax=Cydia strobilella TaxID=1100964 RepID=UPI0030049310
MSKEIADEYASSLADLTVNSKPLINMLTILAEENVDHAGVIVDTVEKHLEKVQADIKLPVLYLVDSIIKNVGGAYVQKFSQIIVNMFTRTFKQVDEKVRSQMFKLRETWHDVFPATKLYQLDVKVNLIDPAWPIQAQPHQSTIHVNPNFLKKPPASATTSTPSPEEEEKMKLILAKKEKELLMLQQKKIEIELEKTRRALEIAAATNTKMPVIPTVVPNMPVALVNPVMAPVPEAPPVSIKQRLGPPVSKAPSGARIAPVSAALASARRDPRLARRQPPPPVAVSVPTPAPVMLPTSVVPTPAPIAPNVFDIKPLERAVTKRKNVITIDVRPDAARRDPRLDKRLERREKQQRLEARREEELRRRAAREARRERKNEVKPVEEEKIEEKYPEMDIDKLQIADAKKISKLPPIPKIKREGKDEKREKNAARLEKKKKRENSESSKESSTSSSPEKKPKHKKEKKEKPVPEEQEVVAFKELKNYHPERYRNRARSPSPAPASAPAPVEPRDTNEAAESKDVDLRVLPTVEVEKAAPIAQKRSSTELLEGKPKKNKIDKFDRLFGNEDVDLRQLPQVEETAASPKADSGVFTQDSPHVSPKKDWNEVKEREETKKTPSKLDLVRAKLAEATKGKDRLGRPFLFSKSPSVEKERRRTISSEDVDLRLENPEEFDCEDHKKTISIIMNQAKEQFSDGKLDKNQYNTLMFQVLQLNEKLKLKEAKQRESLEISKRKLHAHVENNKVPSPKSSPKGNNFGDIDERVIPGPFPEPDGPPEMNFMQDSDMRMMEGHSKGLLPRPPMMPMFAGPGPQPVWRGPFRPRVDEFARRPRGVVPPFFRGKFDKRAPRASFDPRLPFPAPQMQLPTPQMGNFQGECPLEPYDRSGTPPPLGAPGVIIPPTNIQALEYVDQDPVKTIQIDGIPREIRFYGETAVIMMDWDDPREIKFLPGSRRVTFDNKDSIVLNFNEDYKQVEIDDQVFNIRFGAPTRELFVNGRWHECFFGGAPLGAIIDGKPRLIHLEGPLPQVDIGKLKRTDLVGGKINLIVDATQMCPVFLDAKVQKFSINNQFFTIRFVDAFRTVLINEQPFQVEFGGLPRPIFIGNEKHFIRFSVLPRHVRPGHNPPPGMQGAEVAPNEAVVPTRVEKMETDPEPPRPNKTPSPENEMSNQGGLDMLASLMPSSMAPASASDYTSAEPLFPPNPTRPNNIPGLEAPPTEQKPAFPILGNIGDLFAKLVATGIIKTQEAKEETKEREEPRVEEKVKPRENRHVIHRVDLSRPETLRQKQPALVSKLYGGMQCSGCGARFPPEHTVRYSQHLDWHFRQNRRERDSARRAHSRHWHYDLADWVQYEELEDLEEREKSWFETGDAPAGAEPPAAETETPSVAAGAPARAACALCGDAFLQFYNEDQEEWHLRNSVRHDDNNYHPLCLEDYKASLTKDEPPKEETPQEEKMEEAIEIKDVDETIDNSDNESVVEVVDNDKPVEIDDLDDTSEPAPEPPKEESPEEILEDGDEDDVVFKAEPVPEVVVEDYDTDDETHAERKQRDEQAKIDYENIRIKQEPVDPDDEPIITAEEEAVLAAPDTSRAATLAAIDGNAEPRAPTAPPPAPIRINISAPAHKPSAAGPGPGTAPAPTSTATPPRAEPEESDDEPPPPGEEPELSFTVKPELQGVAFSRQPPVHKGSELSGLCSIM